MTNFGARAILALPRRAGQGAEAELRLLIALEASTRAADDGARRIPLARVAEFAGLPEISARRARDRLVTRGLIEYQRGPRGRGSVWRLMFPIALTLGERETSGYALTLGERNQNAEPVRDHPGRAQSAESLRSPDPGIALTLGRAPELSTTDETSVTSTADRARDDDAQPDWRRGPGPREPAPGQTGIRRDGRRTPTPPPWAAPNGRALPTERVAELAADAKRRLADRPRPEGAPPPPPRTENKHRAEARRQARDAHRRRAAETVTEPAKPDEEPPDECPF